MASAEGAFLNHIARESPDIKRLANFYQEVLGFEEIKGPKCEFGVIWLDLPSLRLHLIERNPETKLPEGPWGSNSSGADPKNISRGHHIALTISNFDSFVQSLKEKGIEFHQRAPPNKSKVIKQVFFFDPDGNGLEVNCVVN